MSGKPIACQLHPAYLGLSETFIHRFVGNLKRWQAVVLTEQTQNANYYNFGERYTVRETGQGAELPYQVWSKLVRATQPSIGGYYATHARYSRKLVQIRPTLLHAHFGTTGWSSLPLRRLHRLPLLVSFYGYDASALLREEIWRQRYQELFEIASSFTTPSQALAERLERTGCPTDKLHILRNGIDLDEWPFRHARSSDTENNVKLLMVSRLVEKKGVLYALRAIAESRQSIPGIRLQIAGDGELRSEIERTIAELGLDDCVKLLGSVSIMQSRELMTSSDILLVPSITAANGDEEGLPTVLIEAAALGLPIIATNHAGIPELVRDGKSGFLVPERDSQALAERIILLVRHPALRQEFVNAARRIAEREYNLSVTVAQLETLYDNLSASKSSST